MRVLFPLPREDFDPTESSVPWRLLLDAGHEVVFATPDGAPARPDHRVLTGRGFGPWRPFLRARPHARELCAAMEGAPEFQRPLPFEALRTETFDGLVLTGGHAPGMRSYLDSEIVHAVVAAMMTSGKPVGAICHGVLAAARARDPQTGRSVLHGRKSTSLTRSQELTAWGLTLWLGRYYRTYALTVQAEVEQALASPKDYLPGPFSVRREDHPARHDRGFVVRDGNYLSARYYGDTYRFAREFLAMLDEFAEMRDAVG